MGTKKFRLVLESDEGERREMIEALDLDLAQAREFCELVTEVTNYMCAQLGKPGGKLISVEEIREEGEDGSEN